MWILVIFILSFLGRKILLKSSEHFYKTNKYIIVPGDSIASAAIWAVVRSAVDEGRLEELRSKAAAEVEGDEGEAAVEGEAEVEALGEAVDEDDCLPDFLLFLVFGWKTWSSSVSLSICVTILLLPKTLMLKQLKENTVMKFRLGSL